MRPDDGGAQRLKPRGQGRGVVEHLVPFFEQRAAEVQERAVEVAVYMCVLVVWWCMYV